MDGVGTPPLGRPIPLRSAHDLGAFDCGESPLNEWLKKRAIRNEKGGASRTYVVCEADSERVVGYYCLSAGSIDRGTAPGPVRRNMPDPVPVMVLGRLAVDRSVQGRGVGKGLLRDAVSRTLRAAEIAGVRALLVHSLSEDAASFYEAAGFRRSPIDDSILMVRLSDLSATVGPDAVESE